MTHVSDHQNFINLMHYFIKLFTKILPSYQVSESQKRRAEECVDMMKLAVCPQNLNKDRMIGFKSKHVLKNNFVQSQKKGDRMF